MGNHPSTNEKTKKHSSSRKSSSASGDEINPPATNVALENLAKILAEKSAEENSVQGIACRTFSTTLFPRYIDLGLRIFACLCSSVDNSNVDLILVPDFITEVDKILCTVTEEEIVTVYMKIYSDSKSEITQGALSDLLLVACRIALDHYPEGPQTCENIPNTILSVVTAAFHGKGSLPASSIGRWISANCPHLLPGIHKYVVHILTTAHRTQDLHGSLEPILEKEKSTNDEEPIASMPLSLIWLLSTSLPSLFTGGQVTAAAPQPLLTAHQIVLKMMASILPSHWLPLYNSNCHGLGSNRFLTHVLNYKSPTLTIIYSEGHSTFLLATGTEWRESQNYWGGPDCVLMQISPEYHVIERGEKLMYLNFSIRGFPMGIRGGSNPREPSLIVDGDLTTLTYRKIPYKLDSIEVWGCGKEEVREAQLEVKKWQVKEAEKQRVVKLSADDWLDHPDRYLLEMNGRTNYNEKTGPDQNN